MNKNRAIAILKDFNDYRRNKGRYDSDVPQEPKYKASDIGSAIDTAIEVLSELSVDEFSEKGNRMPVIDAVVEETGVSLEDIRSGKRDREIVVARDIAAWLLRREGYTLKETGKVVNRCYTNVLHQCEEVDFWICTPDQHEREMTLLGNVKKRLIRKK